MELLPEYALFFFFKGGQLTTKSDKHTWLSALYVLLLIITFSVYTFATTVTLANNISLEVVSKMLGHTNTRMTAHYAKLVDESIAKQMDQLTNIFNE